MSSKFASPQTLADVLAILPSTDLSPVQARDMTSAIRRLSEMAGHSPSEMPVEARALRERLQSIRPARFSVSPKTFSNLRSLLAATLRLVGAIDDMNRGLARRDPLWGPLLQKVAGERRLAEGLATFANWGAANGIAPEAVDDNCVRSFGDWLESRTHCPKPRDVVRRVPLLWNEASARIEGWPRARLARVSFKRPRMRVAWGDLPESFRKDGESYLEKRTNPDIFDETGSAPRRPLAPQTLHQQREHIRLASSVLLEAGLDVSGIDSLGILVEPEDLVSLEARQAEIGGELAGLDNEPVRLHPNLSRLYREKVAMLHALLADDGARTEAVEIIRTLIDRIVLTPAEGKGLEVELVGDIARMIQVARQSDGHSPTSTAILDMDIRSVKLDAGAGFEPATFRL